MAIKKGDFVELEYIGKIVASDQIFDLTSGELAKEKGIFNPKQKYGPVIICIGEGHLLPGLDIFLVGKDIGKDYDVSLEPELAFGKRSAKLVQLTSLSKFKGQKVPPYPGAQFMIDNTPAIVKSVSGGRVILDFNHPLAGKKLSYWVKVSKIVKDTKKQAEAVLEKIGLLSGKYSLKVDGKTLKIKCDKDIEKLLSAGLKEIEKSIKRLVASIEKVELVSNKN